MRKRLLLLVLAVCYYSSVYSVDCNFSAPNNGVSDTYNFSTICGSSPYTNVTISLEEGDILLFDNPTEDIGNGSLTLVFNGNNISVKIPNSLTVNGGVSIVGSGSGEFEVGGYLEVIGNWDSQGVDLDIKGGGDIKFNGAMAVSPGTDCSGPCPTYDFFGACGGNLTYCNDHVNCGASCDQPLPITLLYFNATLVENLVVLKWATAIEVNNNYFSIEASNDGKEFYLVKEIPGAGNSTQLLTYQEHVSPEPWPVTYYRLKQTDFDGTSTYSKVVLVRQGDGEGGVSVYPNPTDNGNFTLRMKVSSGAQVWAFDALGKKVYQQTFSSRTSAYWVEEPISLTGFGRGAYTLRIQQGDKVVHKKVIY
ncbi:T9SS type A sorting domain-containing protein [Rapidithrix thailandica]|uniref:T9SS type A sorting domain-containing protein n=1 Tax=Rapidithrix thailandica TaxID=413964 RepID=A0AAW9SFC4_9BACT